MKVKVVFPLAMFLRQKCQRQWYSTNIIVLTLATLGDDPDSRFSPIREYQRVKYHCTVDLLFDVLGISCTDTDNLCFYLQYRLIQTSQTGGQWYSDTSPFSIPWSHWSGAQRQNYWLMIVRLGVRALPPHVAKNTFTVKRGIIYES